MLYKKRNIFAFFLSLFIHGLILGLVFLAINKANLRADNKTVISLKTVKIIKKPKHVIKKIVHKKPQKIPPKPKPITKPKPKPVVKPKPKPKPVIKPKPKHKKIVKHRRKYKRKIKPIKKIKPHIKPTNTSTTPIKQPKKIAYKKPETQNTTSKKMPALIHTKTDIRKKYLSLNFDKILQAIDNAKFYPQKARMLDIEGNAKVKFIIKKNGTIEILNATSNKRFLKNAAIEIVKRAAPDFPKPPEDVTVNVTIAFKLDE